ncbi:MAG: hypothetical protein J7K21_00965 [Desulfurococcales archaeon]|nr:hypothetical protein [Desulfurococcales archaeon]
MQVKKEFEVSRPLKQIVFKIPIVNLKWRCCISGDIIDTSFLEIRIRPYMNMTVEFLGFMRKVLDLFKAKVESSDCTIAEEIAIWIKQGLEKEYPLHELTVKLVFLEKDKETGLVATIEVEA